MSSPTQEFVKKAASLLLQYATIIGQTAINDMENNAQKDGILNIDSVIINNNVIINHDSKNNIDTKNCVKNIVIKSSPRQEFVKKAASLLLQYATIIGQTAMNDMENNDQNNGILNNDSVIINNNVIINHVSKTNIMNTKKNMNLKDRGVVVTNNHKTKNNSQVDETHEAKDSFEVMDTHEVKNNQEALVTCYILGSLCKKNNTESDLAAHMETHKAMFGHMNSSFVKLTPVTVFECDFCTSCFASNELLKEHQRKYYKKTILAQNRPNHDPSKPYHCKVCGWSYRQESTLKAHLVIHKPAPHACECGVAFYRAEDLDSHRILLSHHSPEPKPTNNTSAKITTSKTDTKNKTNKIANKKTKIKTIAKRNSISKKHATKKASNNTSVKKTTSKTDTKNKTIKFANKKTNIKTIAKRNHISEKPIECRVNGNTVFVDRDEKGLYQCSFCDAAFKVGKHFRDHMQLKHGWSFDFMNTCDICGKTLKSTSNKKLHMLVHTGERPHSCPICNQRFTQRVVVKYHIKRIHTRERDFACSMCPKKFTEKAKMQIHERTHTGEKPYVCRTCSKPFSDRNAWKRHEVIHTGLKPHRCASCPAAFCDPAALFRHKRSHAH